jgi:hypothetical protein
MPDWRWWHCLTCREERLTVGWLAQRYACDHGFGYGHVYGPELKTHAHPKLAYAREFVERQRCPSPATGLFAPDQHPTGVSAISGQPSDKSYAIADRLSHCSYCGEAVFKLHLYSGPAGPTDIDWRPWTIEDETPPEVDGKDRPLTASTLQRWVEERPYRLGLVVVDLAHGTYQAATDKPRGRLRPGALHKLHFCAAKESALYGTTTVGRSRTGDHPERGQG